MREADDSKVLSYLIDTDEGCSTLRHRRFLKPLNVPTNDDTIKVDDTTIAQVNPSNASNSGEIKKLKLKLSVYF